MAQVKPPNVQRQRYTGVCSRSWNPSSVQESTSMTGEAQEWASQRERYASLAGWTQGLKTARWTPRSTRGWQCCLSTLSNSSGSTCLWVLKIRVRCGCVLWKSMFKKCTCDKEKRLNCFNPFNPGYLFPTSLGHISLKLNTLPEAIYFLCLDAEIYSLMASDEVMMPGG